MARLGSVLSVVGLMGLVACRPMEMPDVPDVGRTDSGTQDRPDIVNPTDVQGGTDVQNVDVQTDTGPITVTIQQLQNPTAAGHPAEGTFVNLNQTGMVALTPRMLIRSPDPADAGGSTRCYMGVWVGDGTGGQYSGVQVQELVRLRDAGSCFEAQFRIPRDIKPGDSVTGIVGAQYSEFCATSGTSGACPGNDQTQLFGPDDFITTPGTTPPTPTGVTLTNVGGTNGAAGPETTAREGTLVRLTGVQTTTSPDPTNPSFTLYEVYDMANQSGPRLTVDISNIAQASALRMCWMNQPNTTVTVTGVLFPSFSRWRLKLRSVADVTGLNCPAIMTDGGTGDGG